MPKLINEKNELIMSTEPFIGEIKIFGFQFSVRGYDYCNGQSYSIAQYTALFSLLGTTYGGNGQTTFNLPDLRGRMPIGQGQGPGLDNYTIGEVAGSENVILTAQNLPTHIHTLNAVKVSQPVNNTISDSDFPAGAYPGMNGTNQVYAENATPNTFMAKATVTGSTDNTGSSNPFGIMNPYLVINYNIATEGIFPSRN